jgi:hypothetical protein
VSERFINALKNRIESLTSKTFTFDATVLGMGKETPCEISGTVYFSSDFVDKESIEKLDERSKKQHGFAHWGGEKYLGIETWKMEKDRHITSVLRLKEENEGIPEDVVLVVGAGFDPDNIPRIAPFTQAIFTKVGLLSHMAIVTREYFQGDLEGKMESLVVLTDVKTKKLKGGDKVEINMSDNNLSAEVKVTRLPTR